MHIKGPGQACYMFFTCPSLQARRQQYQQDGQSSLAADLRSMFGELQVSICDLGMCLARCSHVPVLLLVAAAMHTRDFAEIGRQAR